MANDSNNRVLKKNDIFGAKIRATKLNQQWQPPQLILSYVKDITLDADQNPVAYINDVFIPLQQRDDINGVTSNGIGPRLGLPNIFGKYDATKQGSLFKRATVWDEVAHRYTDVPAGASFTKIVEGHRITADYNTADRVEMKLSAVFDQIKSELKVRVGQVRDNTADGGWRPAAPWPSQFKRLVEFNGVPVEATIVHQTVKLLSNDTILLDRAPRDVEAAAPTADIGETL